VLQLLDVLDEVHQDGPMLLLCPFELLEAVRQNFVGGDLPEPPQLEITICDFQFSVSSTES
jgi:hypothetical protein